MERFYVIALIHNKPSLIFEQSVEPSLSFLMILKLTLFGTELHSDYLEHLKHANINYSMSEEDNLMTCNGSVGVGKLEG